MTPFQLFREAPTRIRSNWPTIWKVLVVSAGSTTLAVVLMAWQASKFCREHHHRSAPLVEHTTPYDFPGIAEIYRRLSVGCTALEATRLEARTETRRYALEAFPSWVAAHPDRLCPQSIDELNIYIGRNDSRDIYGGSYEMSCGEGGVGITVSSRGPDGVANTDDDVRSDR